MTALHIDFETRSPVDLRRTNVYVYAADPHTDLWCAAYAFGDEPPALWRLGEPMPPRIRAHVVATGELVAWNAQFERVIWRDILGPRYGWPVPTTRQWRCAMAEAYALALPGSLSGCAAALRLGAAFQKDATGQALMLRLSAPRSWTVPTDGAPVAPVWWDDEEKIERLGQYCIQDVIVEREIEHRLLRLRPAERELWLLDQRINDRGVGIDAQLCRNAEVLVRRALGAANAEMVRVTKGAVASCNATAQIRGFLVKRHVAAPSIDKASVRALLDGDLAPDARRVLELRQMAAKSSTAKIAAMLARRQADGRMRGNLQYHGASTGRWAGRGAQLQNLPRPTGNLIDETLAAILAGDAAALDQITDNPLQAVTNVIRSAIVAAPERELMAADFSNIEGRVVAWLAGEAGKVERFREFDAGRGADLYLVAAAGIYNVPVDEAKHYRQVGKVCELSLGYQGGAGALDKMARGMGLDLDGAYDSVDAAATHDMKRAAHLSWLARGRASGMTERGWLAADLIKQGWRRNHPAIVFFWQALNAAAMAAIRDPGTVVEVENCPHIQFVMRFGFLFARLPSGRTLSYPQARIAQVEQEVQDRVAWIDGIETPVMKTVRRATVRHACAQANATGWGVQFAYGGYFCENVVQAVARDLMAEAMVRVERAGIPVVLTVHDEVLAEPRKGAVRLDDFVRLLTACPAWAAGLPIAAAGWVGPRYRK